MKYHVIQVDTHELKTLTPSEVIDMETDNEGRIIVHGTNEETYYLLADKDLVTD